MAEAHKILATIKTALEAGERQQYLDLANNHAPVVPPTRRVPIAGPEHRAELATSLARELELVGGKFAGIVSPAELSNRIVTLAREIGAKVIAIGEGASLDMDAIGEALERADIKVVKAVPVADSERLTMREQIANADLGIAEAEYGIASTGTLAVISTETRPGSLTLLPTASLIIVQIDRVVHDLAAMLAAHGPARLIEHRLTLITGPSRTADIEKRIVLGVHGPKALHVIVVWPRDE
ncbi:MAG: lactate utilization protein [Candidatus Binatus sp.]|uniref:LutC/YkgG family protein n=1 Tax=Candidatus Binatus sp. TaxID=2811406 RepID=UPI0027184167|nr:lactate utilization protein [Candidatus Binatus sp.]MDO8432216.1 lactate utilization protein [Candidatus Binatus sp.]